MQRRHGADPGIALDKGRDRQRGYRQRRPQLPTGKGSTFRQPGQRHAEQNTDGDRQHRQPQGIAEQLPYPRTKDQRFNGRPAGVEPNRHHKP